MESTTEDETKNPEIDMEKQAANKRHRKKQKYNQIRKQMEFYFGDSNLSKDRFLKKLISEDECKYPFSLKEMFFT